MKKVIIIILVLHTTLFARTNRDISINSEVKQKSYMGIIVKNTFLGGVFGGLIGGAVFLISGFEADPLLFAYCSGGGMFAGSACSIWEIRHQQKLLEENRYSHFKSKAYPIFRLTFDF
jgi:hypothetical protein